MDEPLLRKIVGPLAMTGTRKNGAQRPETARVASSRRNERPVMRVYNCIRDELDKKLLAPGDKLPSSRQLAIRLGVARNTVTVAYEILTAEGHLFGRVGSGTFVAGRASRQDHPAAQSITPELGTWGAALPTTSGILASSSHRLDFRPGAPSRVGLSASLALLRRAMGGLSKRNLQDADANDPAGCERVRDLLANHLRRAHGIACRGDEVLLTSGTQQALDLVGRLFAAERRVVAVEDPGYPIVVRSFKAAGFRVVSLPVDREGLIVSLIPRDACLIYTTPNRQFPMGYRLTRSRRIALLEHASKIGAYVIEDDYDGELHNIEGRPPCLKALDDTGRVIYLASVSKYLVSQLRFGCVVAPKSLRDVLVTAKWLTDRQLSLPVQLIIETLLQQGVLTRIIRRADRDYARRHEVLRAAIRQQLSQWFSVADDSPGMHLTAIAQPGVDVESLIEAASRKDVGIYSLRLFSVACPVAGLVFGLASLTSAEIREGVSVIHRLMLERNVRGRA